MLRKRSDLGVAVVLVSLLALAFFSTMLLSQGSFTGAVVNEGSNTGTQEDISQGFLDTAVGQVDDSGNNLDSLIQSGGSLITGAVVAPSNPPLGAQAVISSCTTVTTDSELNADVVASGDCLQIGASDITIDGAGYSLFGDGTGAGINISGPYNNVVLMNFSNISNFVYGISLYGVNHSLITNISFYTSNTTLTAGVYLNDTLGINLTNNTYFAYNKDASGAILFNSNNSLVQGSSFTLEDGPAVLYGGLNTAFSYHNLFDNNYVSVIGPSYSSTYSAALIDFSGYNNFTFNNVTTTVDSVDGLQIWHANYSQVTHNNFTTSSSSSGVALRADAGSDYLNLTNNSFFSSTVDAIWFDTVNALTFYDNLVITTASSAAGIRLDETTNSIFFNNTVHVGDSNALNFRTGNDNNIFEANTIYSASTADAKGAVRFTSTSNSEGNTFLNNNLSAAGNIVYDGDTSGQENSIIYNNSWGQMEWTGVDISVDVAGDMVLTEGFTSLRIANNSLHINSTVFGSANIASIDANYSIYNQTILVKETAFRDDSLCGDCSLVTNTSSSDVYSYYFSAQSFSNFSVVSNSAPALANVLVNTTTRLNYTTDYLQLWLTMLDNESSTMAGEWEVYRDGDLINSGTFQNQPTNTLINPINRTASKNPGENWTAGIRLTDGPFYSAWVNSSVIIRYVTSGDQVYNDILFDYDVTNCTGDCLHIMYDDLVIDLAGYGLIGDQSGFGFNITNRDNISFINANISNYSQAFHIYNSTNINISYSNISDSFTGVFQEVVNNTSMYWNRVSNNTVGLNFSQSHFSLIHGNLFNNTNNALDDGQNWYNTTYNCSLGNYRNIVWGNCTGGNYWSNYNGTDNGSGTPPYAGYPWNISGDWVGDNFIPYNNTQNISLAGFGDYHPLLICEENWTCGSWSSTTCGTRTCTDVNHCGSTRYKPATSLECSGAGIGGDSSSPTFPVFLPSNPLTPGITPANVNNLIALASLQNALSRGDFKVSTSAGTENTGSGISGSFGAQIKVAFENSLDQVVDLEIQPVTGLNLINQERASQLLRERDRSLSDEQLREELLLLELIEKNNIVPLVSKDYSLFIDPFIIDGLAYSDQSIRGFLLKPELVGDKQVFIGPNEKLDVNLELKGGINVVENTYTLAFTKDGEQILTQDVELPLSGIGSEVDFHGDSSSYGFFDLYIVLPEEKTKTGSSVYSVEFSIGLVDEAMIHFPKQYTLLSGLKSFSPLKIFYNDVFGPYTVEHSEGYILAQQFKYNSNIYPKEELIFYVNIYRDGKLLSSKEMQYSGS